VAAATTSSASTPARRRAAAASPLPLPSGAGHTSRGSMLMLSYVVRTQRALAHSGVARGSDSSHEGEEGERAACACIGVAGGSPAGRMAAHPRAAHNVTHAARRRKEGRAAGAGAGGVEQGPPPLAPLRRAWPFSTRGSGVRMLSLGLRLNKDGVCVDLRPPLTADVDVFSTR
jgi:hypothetical protein